MKFSTQEEYGLRCLIQVAKGSPECPVSILEISQAEGLTSTNVAKILHILKNEGFIEGLRGQSGGYILSRPAESIRVSDILNALGGNLYDESFCGKFAGSMAICAHDSSCTVRGLWQRIQNAVTESIGEMSLADLLGGASFKPKPGMKPLAQLGREGKG